MKSSLIVCALLLAFTGIAFAISPVPDTGQTKCYDDVGNEINPCPQPGEPFYGQDAQYSINTQSYTTLGGGIMVQDNVTGLMWEVKDSKDNTPDYGNPHDADNTYNWQDAQDVFIDALNTAEFGGYDDWRMPTVKELSFIRNTNTLNPAINTSYFPNTKNFPYWSYTTIADGSPNFAWYVRFDDGGVGYGGKSAECFVRAVRGGQSSNYFIDNGDGTVTDTATGLMWQQATAPGTYSWEEALNYCEGLTLAEYDDWRLPNINELQSLLDYNRRDPTIDPTYFPDTSSSDYWSSTTYAQYLSWAWDISFVNGNIDGYNKSGNFYVRAVREGMALPDTDGDGMPDDYDNCPTTPNGPDSGTCISGNIGNSCMSNSECGYGGLCSLTQDDWDLDEVGDVCDNCPSTPNGVSGGTCVYCNDGTIGSSCTANEQCSGGYCSMNQEDHDKDNIGDVCDVDIAEDNYPPGGNGCIDACECEGNFDNNGVQDGADAITFKADFGRFDCDAGNTCNGDFDCNGIVDGLDAIMFKQDFGRFDCPYCPTDPWCVYE